LCLYNWQRLEVHNLNPTAAKVWQLCDGQTSPQQMAHQLKGDLTLTQAEELVWLTLKRLEQAHLLADKVVKPAGRKVYTRREMLKGLGVTAALLPVISTIVAPGPIEAQSPHGQPGPAPITQLVLYDAGGTFNGNLGGRAGADALCQASGNRPAGYTNFRAFLSVDVNDEIRDMPGNYGVPTNVPIQGPNGTQLSPNWAGLLDGSIDATLQAAGIGAAPNFWWSGSFVDGSLGTAFGADSCAGWTTNVPSATAGDVTQATGEWLDFDLGVGNFACSNNFRVLCIAF
jgi:hypothetical protein